MSSIAPRSNHERRDAELEAAWENARAALDPTKQSATIPSLVAARSILRMQHANGQAETAWRRLMLFTSDDKMHLDPAQDNAETRAGMPVLRRLELWWKATLFEEIAEVAKNWLCDQHRNSHGWHAAIQGSWPAPGLPQLTRQLSRRLQLAWASDRLVKAQGHYHTALNDPRNQGADTTAAKAQRAVVFLEAAIAALRAEAQREQPAEPRASRSAQGPRPSPGASSRARQAGREAAAEADRRRREANERAAAAERAAEEARRANARRRDEEAQQREETRRRREREAAEEARAREAQATAHAARPDYPPPTPQRSELNGLEQLDHISVDLLVHCPSAMIEDIPVSLQPHWNRALAQSYQGVFDAGQDIAARDRALKLVLVLPELLLRMPPRGGRRGYGALSSRFSAFTEGNFVALVDWWEQDRAAQQPREPPSDSDERRRTLNRALKLIADGHLSKAVKLLTSKGMGDCNDPRVLSQMRAKFPERRSPMPASIGAMAARQPYEPLDLDIRGAIRASQRHAGTGTDGTRVEYYKSLLCHFGCARADSAINEYGQFARLICEGALPAWFYRAYMTGLLLAPIKPNSEPPLDGEAPDCRPLVLGFVPRRIIEKAAVRSVAEAAREYLYPIQVGLEQAGLERAVHSVRLHLEVHTGHLVAKLDVKNAFNSLDRRVVLTRMNEVPGVRNLCPLFHATHTPEAAMHTAQGARLDFDRTAGADQGGPLSSLALCVALQPHLVEANSTLRSAGGMVVAEMDDVYFCGPPWVVQLAMARYKDAIHTDLGLVLQETKSTCLPGAECELPADFAVPRGRLTDAVTGRPIPEGPVGVMVAGVPVGEPAYVAGSLQCKTRDIIAKMELVDRRLRLAHLQSMWVVLRFCLTPLADYWVRLSYPTDTAELASAVDAKLLDLAAACLSQDRAQLNGTAAGTDPTSTRDRLLMPARLKGASLRSRAGVAPLAFASSLIESLSVMLDSSTDNGGTARGHAPHLAGVLGASSFDIGNELTRWRALLSSQTRTAAEFSRAWAEMQSQAQYAAGSAALRPVEAAGLDGAKATPIARRLQRRLTYERESAWYGGLDARFRGLPPGDQRRRAWLNVDEWSATWVNAMPQVRLYLEDVEFREVAASYLGLPSPQCVAALAQRPDLRVQGRQLDPYGNTLTSVTMPGKAWDMAHSNIQRTIAADIAQLGIPIEVECRNKVNSWMPHAFRTQVDNHTAQGQRPLTGVIPDMAVRLEWKGAPTREQLLDVKRIHVNPSNYPNNQRDALAPVKAREQKVHNEYVHKLRKLDQKYGGVSAGECGPMEAQLLTYPPVRGLAFGAFGEVGPNVKALVSAVAEEGKAGVMSRTGIADADVALSTIKWRLRSHWAMTAMRESARVKIARMQQLRGHAGLGRMAQSERDFDKYAAEWRHAGERWRGPVLSGVGGRFC